MDLANFSIPFEILNVTDITNGNSTTTDVVVTPKGPSLLKKLADVVIPGTLLIIMLGMGSTIEVDKLLAQLRRPLGPAIGMLSQFLVLPLSMFAFAHALQLESYAAIGMLVIAACPGGSTSNIFAYWMDGDVPLSLTMTTLSTVFALGMMPLNIWIYSRSWTSEHFHIPHKNIIISLVMTTAPAAVGVFIRWKWEKIAHYVTKVGSFCGVITVALNLILISLLYPFMYKSSWKIYVGAFFLPFIGFAFGYLVSKLFRRNNVFARTVALETGIQNFPLCMTVITLSFPPELIPKLALMPLLDGVFIITNSCIFVFGYYVIKKLKGAKGDKKGIEDQSVSEETENDIRKDLISKI